MPLVSVTRFRARALRFVPMFMFFSQRSISQVRKADGCISIALLKDKGRVFWTMTMWNDERSMKTYITTGAHLKAMPKLSDWADEASVVHWYQRRSKPSRLDRGSASNENRRTRPETSSLWSTSRRSKFPCSVEDIGRVDSEALGGCLRSFGISSGRLRMNAKQPVCNRSNKFSLGTYRSASSGTVARRPARARRMFVQYWMLSSICCERVASGDFCHESFPCGERFIITSEAGRTQACGHVFRKRSISVRRIQAGRVPCPSVVIMDSQSVKTTER